MNIRSSGQGTAAVSEKDFLAVTRTENQSSPLSYPGVVQFDKVVSSRGNKITLLTNTSDKGRIQLAKGSIYEISGHVGIVMFSSSPSDITLDLKNFTTDKCLDCTLGYSNPANNGFDPGFICVIDTKTNSGPIKIGLQISGASNVSQIGSLTSKPWMMVKEL
jgi:hypothetical protein